MAEEVTILRWCDPCLKSGDRTPADLYRLDGSVVDLCSEHSQPVQEARRIMEEYGRKGKASKARQNGSQAVSAAPGRLACPECGNTYQGSQGLGAHRQRKHGVPGRFTRKEETA